MPVDPRPLLLALLLLIPIRATPLRAIPLRGIPLREIQSVAAIKRPEQPVAVCVVAPRVEAIDQGNARGVVPVSDPQLVVVEPLQELRIERGGRLVWHRQASASRPIRGTLAWPVAPIAAGESLTLRLRPLLAPAGAFAQVELIGAAPDRMRAAANLIGNLGRQPAARELPLPDLRHGHDIHDARPECADPDRDDTCPLTRSSICPACASA